MIESQEDFSRAVVKSGATADQLIRALQAIPGDSVLHDFEIDYDFTGSEPFPLSVKVAVEWVRQPGEADTLPDGGAAS